MIWGLMGGSEERWGGERHLGVPLEIRHGLESLLGGQGMVRGSRGWKDMAGGPPRCRRTWFGSPKEVRHDLVISLDVEIWFGSSLEAGAWSGVYLNVIV